MGDLLYFPGQKEPVREEFIERPWKRTLEEWSELIEVDPSLEKKLREFQEAFFDRV
jgi:hypothetical protein